MRGQQYSGRAAESAARAKANWILKSGSIAHLKRKNEQLTKALNLHLAFLKSLPPGWLGKTVADIGLLNSAFIASSKALEL
jgi:hypothetical protein